MANRISVKRGMADNSDLFGGAARKAAPATPAKKEAPRTGTPGEAGPLMKNVALFGGLLQLAAASRAARAMEES